MTYKGDPLAEKLDRVAEATGFPRLQRRLRYGNPVRFRLVPLILLALAIAGLGLEIFQPNGLGYVVILTVWSATTIVFTLGPLNRRLGGKLDEREAAVVRNGHFAGLLVAFGVAVLGTFAFGLGKIGAMVRLWDVWTPETGLD